MPTVGQSLHRFVQLFQHCLVNILLSVIFCFGRSFLTCLGIRNRTEGICGFMHGSYLDNLCNSKAFGIVCCTLFHVKPITKSFSGHHIISILAPGFQSKTGETTSNPLVRCGCHVTNPTCTSEGIRYLIVVHIACTGGSYREDILLECRYKATNIEVVLL